MVPEGFLMIYSRRKVVTDQQGCMQRTPITLWKIQDRAKLRREGLRTKINGHLTQRGPREIRPLRVRREEKGVGDNTTDKGRTMLRTDRTLALRTTWRGVDVFRGTKNEFPSRKTEARSGLLKKDLHLTDRRETQNSRVPQMKSGRERSKIHRRHISLSAQIGAQLESIHRRRRKTRVFQAKGFREGGGLLISPTRTHTLEIL